MTAFSNEIERPPVLRDHMPEEARLKMKSIAVEDGQAYFRIDFVVGLETNRKV